MHTLENQNRVLESKVEPLEKSLKKFYDHTEQFCRRNSLSGIVENTDDYNEVGR